MLSGIDEKDPGIANECLQLALNSPYLKSSNRNIYAALKVTSHRLNEIVTHLKKGNLEAYDCVILSYGQRLNSLSVNELLPLIEELSSNHGADGVWSALEIISMYQHGQVAASKRLENRLAKLLTSPTLLHKTKRGNQDGYLFESLSRDPSQKEGD